MKLLILGVNGFIGNSLVRAVLDRTDWEVVGMDLARDKLDHSLGDARFRFVAGDITTSRDWVDQRIAECDVVLPLVAIATPMAYVRQPLRVFELTFEENLRVVRQCVTFGKRLVFPSTSEVYGMCADPAFVEDASPLVLGPVHKQRWIYACSKQLLDRVIWAYGQEGQLDFTLFRPFNWIGPRLDDPRSAREGSSRVVTQFIENLVHGRPIELVDGGRQERCFTWVDDGIDGLLRILENPGGVASGEIFNLGHPDNSCSMIDLARRLAALYRAHPAGGPHGPASPIVSVAADAHYGPGYQDIATRTPSIEKARRLLGFCPRVGLDEALARTVDAYLTPGMRVERSDGVQAQVAGQL